MTARNAATSSVQETPSTQGWLLLLEASFARLRLGMTVMPSMGLLFGLLLGWEGGPVAPLLVWGGVYLPVLLFVRWGHRRYLHERTVQSPEALLTTWTRRVRRLALAHGVGVSLSVVLPLGQASYEFMLLLYITLAGILAGNAAQMTATLAVYRMYFIGAVGGLAMIPWAFPGQWPFILPMTLITAAVIYRSAVNSHRFFVRQVVLEERSRDLAERYREASQAAERALAEKNHFLTTAAHDLRQPVHAMALLAEAIALHGRGHPHIDNLLVQWRLSMRSVNHMFDALLDLSRIESGAVELRPAPVSLAALFEDLRTQFATDASARGLVLRLHPPPHGAAVLADPALVRQSVANLVQNALRYTPEGGVLVGARRRGVHWRIEVWDTGVGVALHEQAQIYQAFYRPEHAWQVHRSGHGLGLAVVARCVALMQARQGLQSRLGKGSCFWLELPATQQAAATLTTVPTAAPGTSPPLRGRCLVLDDDPHVLNAWSTLLVTWGIDVRLASNAAEAFAHLDTGFAPHSILCDQRLRSGESGFDVLRALLDRCPDARGAMVSGEYDSPELQTAQDEGYLVLRKPVDVDELHAVLSQWLRGQKFE
ncbi:MAG: ATP-binding protein [Acidovorax sp.]|uniref:hybrid sensor histidine kinase/response regulator n=1 Tax=Acidovorax sp. TaxID=1872122 RepID=UPI00391D0C6E